MALTTTDRLKNGLVRRVRSVGELRTALVGGVHQNTASRRVRYPFLTYSEVSAPFIQDWGGSDNGGTREIRWLVDLTIWALNPVQAENLLLLLDGAFSGQRADKELQPFVVGQTVTLCRATGVRPPTGPERDDEGRRVFDRGITVEIWSTQPIPLSTGP